MDFSTVSADRIVSPYDELIAFEYLYSRQGATLQKIARETVMEDKLPHEALVCRYGMLEPEGLDETREFIDKRIGTFSIVLNRTPSWPCKLSDSARPTPLLYYQGDIGLLEACSVSVVGARKATEDGKRRARLIAKQLAERGIVVVTGLAAGIDTAATRSALCHGGRTIGVIGTPIDEHYPKENFDLQNFVAARHLLLSQVPLYRYSMQPFRTKKYYFPERNELMAAVSDATVIVEASDTSGTLTQARACLRQGRPLFIMRSCAECADIAWPAKYLAKDGVYLLDSVDQITDILQERRK